VGKRAAREEDARSGAEERHGAGREDRAGDRPRQLGGLADLQLDCERKNDENTICIPRSIATSAKSAGRTSLSGPNPEATQRAAMPKSTPKPMRKSAAPAASARSRLNTRRRTRRARSTGWRRSVTASVFA